MNKKFQHFSLEKRQQLSLCLEKGFKKSDIAKLLGVSDSSIYREIRRGTINGKYSAQFAQDKYNEILMSKGKTSFFDKTNEIAIMVSNWILNENLSPKSIIIRLRELGYDFPNSVNTIYSAIDKGLIPNVSRKDLCRSSTKVFSNGLIQIPKWIRDELNLNDGDQVGIKLVGNSIIIDKGSPNT